MGKGLHIRLTVPMGIELAELLKQIPAGKARNIELIRLATNGMKQEQFAAGVNRLPECGIDNPISDTEVKENQEMASHDAAHNGENAARPTKSALASFDLMSV